MHCPIPTLPVLALFAFLLCCLVGLPVPARAADTSVLKVTVFASLGKALPLEMVAGFFKGYAITRQGDALHIKPAGYAGKDSIVCTVQQRGKDDNANTFTDGLMDIFTSAKDHVLMAQAWYTDTKITFTLSKPLANFNNYNHILYIRQLCMKVQGFTYDHEDSVVATEFVSATGALDVYNGVLIDLSVSPPVSSNREAKPRFHIAESVYKSWPRHSAALDEVYRAQRQLAAKTAALPVAERARAAYNGGAYSIAAGLLEAINPAKRSAEEAALLGMTYHAQSYFNINDGAGRKKAVDTLMATQGKDNADWHYALSYVLHVWDPAAAAQHAQRALDLDSHQFDFVKNTIKNRQEQVARDARIREEVLKNNAAPRKEAFVGFNTKAFWKDSDYARKEIISPVASEAEMTARAQAVRQRTGYRLPSSYITFMRHQNGGIPTRTFHKTDTPTSWSDGGVAIEDLYAVADDKAFSLLGAFGSRAKIEDAAYPDIGIYFASTPTGGHDMLALDYRFCGPEGEPAVVHVDKESHFAITFVAKDFETFIKGLQKSEDD